MTEMCSQCEVEYGQPQADCEECGDSNEEPPHPEQTADQRREQKRQAKVNRLESQRFQR